MKFGIAVGAFSGLAPAALLLWPVDGDRVAVIAGRNTVPVIAAADGQVVSAIDRFGAVVAQSDGKNFVSRLYGAGATLVIRAPSGPACGVTTSRRIGP